ncbi:quinone oxidoreductase family protein [Humibacter soli]
MRSQAAGAHYTSTDELPLVPGIDGVGRTAEGQLLYFILPDSALGSMAERTVIDRRRSISLPAGVDPVQIAAAMNPAMSSWVALRRRIAIQPGQNVLVLGATGNAGRLAIQVAKYLGAGNVTAVGRGAHRLTGQGADAIVSLDGDEHEVAEVLGDAGTEIDIVLDYLWGAPTSDALRAIVPRREDDERQLTWIQVGSVAGADAAIPSAALRATKLQLIGSGQGSVTTGDIVTELSALTAAMSDAAFVISARPVALRHVQQAWQESTGSTDRLVLTTSE